jgi:(S)-2-hydroxyglutarate dehydrogenase
MATARAFLERRPGARVLVLEKEPELGRHQSGRNFGVVHAGVYYEAGSLKATLCREGREALLAFADERGIPYAVRGKVIVATSEPELPRLAELSRRASANGVRDVRTINEAELAKIEPHVRGLLALHVPETAVIDFRAVLAALADDVRERGGEVMLRQEVRRVGGEARRRLRRAASRPALPRLRLSHRALPRGLPSRHATLG